MEKKTFFLLFFVAILAIGLIMGQLQKRSSFAEVVIGGEKIIVELADTIEKRRKGLSERDSLDKDSGMLFVFDIAGDYGIWMKDMNFPIDIFWVKDNEIIDIAPNITHEDQKTTYFPRDEANYVLEFNSGFMEEKDIKIGDKVDIIF